MNKQPNKQSATTSATRYLWIGPVMGILCMIGLFVYGLNINQPGLLVMSSTTALLLAVVWSTTHLSTKKRGSL